MGGNSTHRITEDEQREKGAAHEDGVTQEDGVLSRAPCTTRLSLTV